MTSPVEPAGISVCIPSVRASTIEHAVESVRRQTRDDWEVIVVMQGDDADLRSRVDALSRADGRVRGLWIPEKGVSRARNLGVRTAKYDVVTFLDDDCEAAPDWLERVRSALTDQPDVGVVAGSLVAPPGPRWPISTCPSAYPDDFTMRRSPEDSSLPDGAAFVSANLTVRRAAWEAVGTFDERLGPGAEFAAGEDLDLLLRLVRASMPIRFLPGAVVHHTHGRRYGLRAVLRMVTAYGSGQGAVAAKLTHTSEPGATEWTGVTWRRHVWREAIWVPVRTLRPHRIARALPRAIAFERSYRRCLREYTVDRHGHLVPLVDR